MLERNFDYDKLYGKVVRYYLKKKHFDKEKANFIAQSIVMRERKKRTCQNSRCGHTLYDHLRNHETCLVNECSCSGFVGF